MKDLTTLISLLFALTFSYPVFAENTEQIKRGEKVFQKMGCMACHGSQTTQGPRLENLYQSVVTLKSGEAIKADESYIRESILKPSEKIVRGFQPIMPTYKGMINEKDLEDLVEYLKNLKVDESEHKDQ